MLVTSKSLVGLNEECNFLDDSCYLTEQESLFYPAMVPIVENTRLGLNLIKLEDLVDYSMSNGITDAGYAISNVCEASNIDISTVGLYVNETSVIADPEMEDTVRCFIENNVPTFIAPLPKDDIAYIMAEAVVSCMEDYNNADFLLEAYVYDDLDTLFNEEAFNEELSIRVVNGKKAKGKIKEIGDKIKHAGVSVSAVSKNKLQTIYDKITTTVRDAKNASASWVSKKIASLGNLLSTYKQKAQDTASSGYKVICNKLSSAIDFLKSKLPGNK